MEASCQEAGIKCFVTGASGFIGRRLVQALIGKDASLERTDLRCDEKWDRLLSGHEVLIHCAGLSGGRGVTQAHLDAVNIEGTLRIARIAQDVGVRRFIFMSSVKVFGEFTKEGEVFSDRSQRVPVSAYARSKAMAEDGLAKLHSSGYFEVVVVRPTVVVGKGMKGAVALLGRFAERGIPLPIGSFENRRSFLMIENLVDAIRVAAIHPCAAGGAYIVNDGDAVSTQEFFECLAEALGKKARFGRVDSKMSRWLLKSIGFDGLWHRLFGNLEVDGDLIRKELGWAPAVGTLEGVCRITCRKAEHRGS